MISVMRFLFNIMLCVILLPPQHTVDVHPASGKCWLTVCDAGPAFTQPWANVLCLNGHSSMYRIRTDSKYVNNYGTLFVHKPDKLYDGCTPRYLILTI